MTKTEKEPGIVTRNLNVTFNGVPAIENIDLELHRNTVAAVIGPSGCGKSTFLRALNLMHDMTPRCKVTGQITILDKEITEYTGVELRKRVGMIFQKPNPFPDMSIFDNVISGWKLSGMHNKKFYNEIAEKALRNSDLWDEVKDRLKEPAISLSGGQQQRLCIARTLAVEPYIILMDEPTSALDPISTQNVENTIYSLKSEYTFIIVTHNMQQAARISDVTAFFYLGKLVEVGGTRKIFTNPDEKLTEDYVTGKFG